MKDGALVDGPHRGPQVGAAGEHDAGHFGVVCGDPCQQVGAGHAGHLLIRDDHVDVAAFEDPLSLRAGRGRVELIGLMAQRASQPVKNVSVVVDQQYDFLHDVHPFQQTTSAVLNRPASFPAA